MGANARKMINELLQRCQAVGWQVVKTGGDHYKVDTKRGVFIVSSTPKSETSVRDSVADARRFGLEELERRLAERRERDRQARIDDDRAANDARLVRANGGGSVVAVTVEPNDEVDGDRQSPPEPTPDLGSVDGVRIVEIAPAMIQTPLMRKPAPYSGGEELLLADGRVVYRCIKLGTWRVDERSVVDQTTPCHATFDGIKSLMSHVMFHAQKAEDISARRSGAGRGAKKLPKENEVEKIPALEKIAAAYNGEKIAAAAAAAEPASFDAARNLLLTQVEELAGAVVDLGGKLIDVRNGLIAAVDRIRQLEPDPVPVVEVDPALVAKAAKFDALRETFGHLLQ